MKRFWPIFFIFFVWFIFSFPYFIQHKVPYPSNLQVNTVAPWSSYERFWGPVKNSAMPDIIGQIYPWRYFDIQELKKGHPPLWNPYVFSGNVQLANYQSAVFQPFNLIFFLLNFIDGWTILVLLQPLLAALFTYFFARSIKLSNVSSLLSSVSFMFCGFITTWMGYATLDYAILFLPLALFSIEKYFEKRKITYLIILAATIPFSLFSGHFQISLYFLISTTSYLVFRQIQMKRLDPYPFLYIFFGILISMIQLLPSLEAYREAVRSNIFQKIEAIPLSHLITIIAPDFFGNPVTKNNPIGHYAEWSMFAGVLSFLFATFSLSKIRKNKTVLFFAGAAVLSLLLAFDSPITVLLVALKIPVISTSSLSRIVVLFSFSISILAGIGISQIENLQNSNRKKIFLSFLIPVSIIALLLVSGSSEIISGSQVALKNLVLPLGFISLGIAGVLFGLFNKKMWIKISVIILLLTSFEMLRFSTKWMPQDPKENIFARTSIGDYLEKNKTLNRTIGVLGQENFTTYSLLGIDGYDPIYIKRYGEFIAFANNGYLSSPPRVGVSFDFNGKYSKKALNLLGVKYIIQKVGDEEKPWAFPFKSFPKNTFQTIFNDGKFKVYEDRNSFPRAFLSGKFIVVSGDEQILRSTFDNTGKIVLEKDPGIKESDAAGNLNIAQYDPTKIVFNAKSEKDTLLFLSDNFYPGWKATIDGNNAQVLRADYAFRAVPIPKGNHRVVMSFEPDSFKYGSLLSLTGAIFLIGSVFLKKSKLVER